MVLQSIITNHLDIKEHVLTGSLDLSTAFDIVNVDLLLKRLSILALPRDIIHLITIWLEYVTNKWQKSNGH